MSDTDEPPQRANRAPRPPPTDEETYEIILEANGLTREQLARKPQAAERLEIFMVNYRRMVCLDRFPQLRHLEIVQQELTEIEGLHACAALEVLFLPDNSITRLGGLEACVRLRELQLSGNQIERIEGVRHLHALEVRAHERVIVYDHFCSFLCRAFQSVCCRRRRIYRCYSCAIIASIASTPTRLASVARSSASGSPAIASRAWAPRSTR